jgi:O-antigen ligase
VLVAGITVLAFDSGGYYESARSWAGVIGWVLFAVLAVVLPPERLRLGRPSLAALGGLALLAVWTAIAKSWSPLPDVAADDVERLVAYVGMFGAALLACTEPMVRRWVGPALALVAVVVVGYGLSERFVPGLLEFEESVAAVGRLAQPLTYWNAMGALAAIGLVLTVRMAADPERPWLRVAAGAVTPLLGLGVYLSFSRAAIFAAVLGVAVLLVLVPLRGQVAAAVIALIGGGAAALLVTRFPAVESLAPGRHAEREGLEMLLIMGALCVAAGVATHLAGGGADIDATPRPRRRVVGAVVALLVLLPVIGAPLALRAEDPPDRGAEASRLSSIGSNRYEYWRVALESIPDHPFKGVGPGGFHVVWMQERPIDEAPHDAHSLQLETAMELGLTGLALLMLTAGAVIAAGATALRRRPAAVTSTVAALVAWGTTTSVDWIWEMPTIALIGLLLSAALLGEARATQESEAAG